MYFYKRVSVLQEQTTLAALPRRATAWYVMGSCIHPSLFFFTIVCQLGCTERLKGLISEFVKHRGSLSHYFVAPQKSSLRTKSISQTLGSTSNPAYWERSIPVHINTAGFMVLSQFEALLKNPARGAAESRLSGPDFALCKPVPACRFTPYRRKSPARRYYGNAPVSWGR